MAKPSRNHARQKRQRQKETASGRRADQASRAAVYVAQAKSAWEAGRFAETIGRYERAVASDPGNPTLIVDLARAHGLRFDFAKAERLMERLQIEYPTQGSVHHMLGNTYVQFKDFGAAEVRYCHALGLALSPRERVRTHVALAQIRERLHRLEEAQESAEAALAEWPDHPKAQLIRARVLMRRGQTGQAQSIYEALRRRDDVSPDVIAESWYAQAQQCDREEDHDKAFAALAKAKAAYRGFDQASWAQANAIAETNTRMMSTVTAQHFTRWSTDGSTLAELFPRGVAWLIGHPRSGTTLLEQVLDAHDDLVSADELEVLASSVYPELAAETRTPRTESMATMLDRATLAQLQSARRNYLQRIEGALREPIRERVLLDKNPEMTLLLPVICRLFPESKIVFALRDPRDVALSCYMQALPLNSVSVHFHTLAGTAAKYARMMTCWLQLRDMIAAPWTEVRYEDTVADLERQARRALEFLDLPWDPKVLSFHQRAQAKHVHSPTYEAVTRPLYATSIGRWRRYERQLAPVLDVLEPFVRALGYD